MLGAILAVGVVPAHADLNIYLQEDAGAIVLVGAGADFSAASFTGTFGPTGIGGTDFKVTIDGASSDNSSPESDLLNSDNAIKNISRATHTLHVWASQNDYTLPTGSPLIIESSLGGSVNRPTLTLSNIFQAYADRGNALLGIGDFTNGLQSATANGSAYDTGSAFGLFSRTGDYSLTTVANFKLTAGAIINFSAHVNALPTPEPSSMAIAGLGALGLIAYVLRRRRA
jgi:MYXO-CTERM domain-containing protein